MRADTWTGDTEIGSLDPGRNVDPRRAPTYSDVRLKPIPQGPPVANPPKPLEAQWVIGFEGMDAKPYANLHCSCRTFTHFELGGTGVAPVARCCKNAPPYPQDRKHTAHLLATRMEPSEFGGAVVAQPGLPPEPGTRIGAPIPDQKQEQTSFDTAQFIDRLVKADMPGAARDAAAIEAATKAQHKKK